MDRTKKRKGDEIISLEDVVDDQINGEKDLIEEAKNQESAAVWGEEGVCTYDKGYIDQPVYACKTCIDLTPTKEPFGMCYGCSMSCHVTHDVYELFKKRAFKCDCGTSKSNGVKCEIQQTTVVQENNKTIDKKEITNTLNKYDHNFNGKYCYCDSLYDYQEDMILCIVCQDWFHEQCIKFNSKINDVPDQDDFQDFICLDCVQKNDGFLLNYFDNIAVPSPSQQQQQQQQKTNQDTIDDTKLCKKPINKSNLKLDLFCKEDWRNQLCKCEQCMQFYKDKNIEYILKKDPDYYEGLEDVDVEIQDEKDVKDVKMTPEEREKYYNNLVDRTQNLFDTVIPLTQQVCLLQGYGEMKERLRQLLERKKDTREIVTKDDIDQFFGELAQHKKKKL